QEVFRWCLNQKGIESVHNPYLFIPSNRYVTTNELKATLSTEDYDSEFRKVKNTNALGSSNMMKLSTLFFSNIRRKSEENGDLKQFVNNPIYLKVNEYLSKIDYRFELVLLDRSKNVYELNLIKGSQKLDLASSSSGEREILNFISGILSLKIENGLIIIDEPEIHLHPIWQKLLLTLIYDLKDEYDIQFIFASHSGTFITYNSLKDIFRIYKDDDNSSRIIKPDEVIAEKDLIHMINTTNNNLLFFADIVILVEGIADKIIFEKILWKVKMDLSLDLEVVIVNVNGKNWFARYQNLLNVFEIQNFVIADFDYLIELSELTLSDLYIVDDIKIDRDVFRNKNSEDGKTLINQLENFIKEDSKEELEEFLVYLKSYRKKLKNFTDEENQRVNNEISKLETSVNTFILRDGEIEDYTITRGGKISSALSQVKDDEFSAWVDSEKFKYLERIIKKICT
ncbi:MAG: ATP-dependent endonuclease, partial [Candidatus Izemoplasmatales bacterium]